MCEEALSAHTERLAELRELVADIAAAVGLDANALLGGEVEALGRRLQDVRESLTVIADVAEAREKLRRETKSELDGTRIYINDIHKSVNGLESESEENGEEKLQLLREHLMALGKAEGQIEKVKNQTVQLTTTRTDTSIIDILQLWQQVFTETFQQYHRLSSRLIKNEEGIGALRLWQEYLMHVQQFLSESIPADYHSLTEHQHLCEVHQNLLTTQQNVLNPDNTRKLASGLVEASVLEQFNSLTNIHNETLSNIMKRHTMIRDRLNAWDKYTADQNKLLNWLKDMEKERERLQLRFVHIRRIPNVINRINNLLSKIPVGEEQANQLAQQQKVLLEFTDDALATSIRMEHAAITQRISNLQAGLNTWMQFLERISKLIKTYEERVKNIQDIFDNIQDIITNSAQEEHLSHSGVSNKLANLKRTKSRLEAMSKDLEQLRVTQEELKECVNPSDMKTINQRVWLLWHQQEDLTHQLAILCHDLEEKLSLRSMFESRQSRFITWTNELEKRLDKESESGALTVKEPEEILRKLETELQAEMSLKEREYNWLITTGNQLVASCGDEYSDVVVKQSLQQKTDETQERWECLENLGRTRANKIHDMMQTMSQLELRIAKIRAWLTEIEKQLSEPVIFEACTKDVIDKKLQEHDKLKKSIEKESGDIGEVLNLCELLLSDADVWKTHFNTESITSAMQNLERRWKNVCGLSAERKRNITFIWNLIQEVLRLSNEQEQWLKDQENKIKELDTSTKKLTKDQIQEKLRKVEKKIKELESHGAAFDILEQTYSKLAKTSGLEPENIQQITSKVRIMIARWHSLTSKAHEILHKLQDEISVYKEFMTAHSNAVVGLTKVDARLTDLQHLSAPSERGTPKEQLKQIESIEEELVAQNTTLQNADKLGLEIMQQSQKEEIAKVQELIDEYQMLWKDITERIMKFKAELKKQVLVKTEIDESVQVETLKFEQDRSTQVNTLPPTLQRMTSISAKDAYIMELHTALGECKENVKDLELITSKDVPQQGSPELNTLGKKIAKISATCQSSIELINHLHDILLNECDATLEDAKSAEVKQLTDYFNQLLEVAKSKEQKIREVK